MRKLLFLILMLVVTAITFAEEQSPLLKLLLDAKTIKCYLDKGAHANWSKGKLNIEIVKFSDSEENSYSIFDSIDIKKGTARFIGNNGAKDISVLLTPTGLTFIEQSENGNLFFTTIFPLKDKVNNKFLCVHSRHIFMSFPMETIIPSQYYGICEILEYNH